jgi:hypothetical protein
MISAMTRLTWIRKATEKCVTTGMKKAGKAGVGYFTFDLNEANLPS